MAFTFDSTVKSATGNSYVSVSYADDYFAGRTKTDNWDNLDTSGKQKALVQATFRLDRERFTGLPTTTTQNLAWPRQLLVDPNGYAIDSQTNPREINQASCELALFILDQDDQLMSEQELENYNSYEVGPLKLSTKYVERDRLPGSVEGLLKAIGPGAWYPASANLVSSMSR